MSDTINVAELVKDFDPGKLTNREAMDVERALGITFTEWGDQLKSGSMTATTALVWILARRTDPSLRIDDVNFTVDDLTTATEPDTTATAVDPAVAAAVPSSPVPAPAEAGTPSAG